MRLNDHIPVTSSDDLIRINDIGQERVKIRAPHPSEVWTNLGSFAV